MDDSCLQRSQSKAAASGISIFLLEELGDARLRAAQLKKYLDEAVQLVEKSGQREHFFEIAGHLLHGIPDTLMRMDKALTAAAMAAAKLDYEETKDELRPEKADELERALEEVRVRRVQRRSKQASSIEENTPMKIPEAVAQLEHLAASIEATGTVDTAALAGLIVNLEGPSNKTASATVEIARVLRTLSANLLDVSDPEQRPSRLMLAATLRRVLGDTVNLRTAAGFGPLKIRNKPHGSGVKTEDFMAAMEQAAENLFSCRGENRSASTALEDALTGYIARIGPLTGMPDAVLRVAQETKKSAYELDRTMGDVARNFENLARDMKRTTPEADRYDVKVASDGEKLSEDTKESRFEEGKPADPTKEMSQEDAKAWKQNTEEHKDKFKSAASGDPRWIHAKYPGKTSDGQSFKKGDLVLYYPNAKTFMAGDKAEAAWRKFETEVADEAVYNSTMTASEDEEKRSRFEEGKPADPTDNMDADDAKKWKDNTEEHKDKFKSASGADRWKAAAGPSTSNGR